MKTAFMLFASIYSVLCFCVINDFSFSWDLKMANQLISYFYLSWERLEMLFESVLLQEDVLRNEFVEEIN